MEDAEYCEECAQRDVIQRVAGKLLGIASTIPDESPEQKWINPIAQVGGQFGYHKEMTHQALMAKATEEARAAKAAAGVEEIQPRMVICRDGPEEGTYAALNSQMPAGAFTNVGGHRYMLTADGILLHTPYYTQ